MNCKSSRDVWSNVYGKKKPICKSASNTDRHGLKLLNDDEFVDENKRKEMEYSIKRLHELISDPITQESKPWIDRLLNNFLDGIKSVGYRVKDLPAIMQVLEFLAWKTRDNPDYQKHLDKMLEHCCWPPRFDKSSEILSSRDVIEHYFSLLGYVIVILSNYQDDISKVLNALCQLLTKTKSIDKSAVKLEYRYEAVEKSKLPSIIANFIEICNIEIFDKVLDLIWIIVSISDTCCHKMIEHGIINNLLIKLPQLLVNSETTNNLNYIEKDVDDKGIQIVNILWKLMASIVFSNDIPITVMKNSIPKLEAMESLKSAFKITLNGSQSSKNFTTIRNDLSVIILSGLTVKWSLVASGLADDIITSSISTTTPTTSDDIFYQKTLQCILCHLAHCDASITIMKKKFVVSKILEDLTSKYNSKTNVNSRDLIEGSGLIENSLKTLQNIVPKIPHQFINENGPSKIISILKLSIKSNLNNSIVEEIAKTICSLLISDDKIMLKKFQDAEIVSTLIGKF
ncbi:uncharacterized protein LOC122849425 [Aphidius gifuensis]|uniref:uncharacterized protein LOC122849425 n=1 Tax=Aphidius gifuensis TaxID=684658 RepID=UPI001CDC5644|nr:uncharacterized protein LOC122849425 [Aphidius gifuensis]